MEYREILISLSDLKERDRIAQVELIPLAHVCGLIPTVNSVKKQKRQMVWSIDILVT